MVDDLLHLDSGESIFFTRELETIRAKTYDIKYDDNFKMLATLPISMEGDPLDIDITHRSYGRVGIAKMGGGDYATDFPSVDIFATETTVKVYPVQASYRYNKDEIARAAKMNRPLESLRAAAKSGQDVAPLIEAAKKVKEDALEAVRVTESAPGREFGSGAESKFGAWS